MVIADDFEQILLQNYKEALDAHAIVATTNTKGQITYVNNMFCHISKYSRRELLGQNHRILNSGQHSSRFFAGMWQKISAGGVWQGDIKNKAKDGSFYWVQTTIMPFKDEHGKIFQYLAIRTDITEKVKAEEKIARSKKHLEQLTAQLKAERLALNNKNIALNELISHLEEEKAKIRTTINSNIETVIYPLLEQVKAHLNQAQKKFLDLIKSTLADISEPFSSSPAALMTKLTPKELQICNHIKQGMSVKEIANLMHLSPRTIEKHRENIRDKLGLKAKKINLTTYLLGTL